MAIRIQRMMRNLPCWARYDLHVSHIISETSSIDLWAGRFFVWLYWMMEKTNPTMQISSPKYIIDIPPTVPPRIVNATLVRSGSTISASPAKVAGAAINSMKTKVNKINNRFRLNIKPIITSLLKKFVPLTLMLITTRFPFPNLAAKLQCPYSKTLFSTLSMNL
jgi:hypothetical protein